MWYLCVFYHRLLDYRKPEVESLAELFGAFSKGEPTNNGDLKSNCSNSLEWKLPEHHHPDSPFHLVSLPSEEIARNVANRSKLCSYCFPTCQWLRIMHKYLLFFSNFFLTLYMLFEADMLKRDEIVIHNQSSFLCSLLKLSVTILRLTIFRIIVVPLVVTFIT